MGSGQTIVVLLCTGGIMQRLGQAQVERIGKVGGHAVVYMRLMHLRVGSDGMPHMMMEPPFSKLPYGRRNERPQYIFPTVQLYLCFVQNVLVATFLCKDSVFYLKRLEQFTFSDINQIFKGALI